MKLLYNPSEPNFNPATLETSFSLAQFTTTCVAQSHIHMVQTLRTLESNMDNKETISSTH